MSALISFTQQWYSRLHDHDRISCACVLHPAHGRAMTARAGRRPVTGGETRQKQESTRRRGGGEDPGLEDWGGEGGVCRLQTGPGHAALGPEPWPRARAKHWARRQARCSNDAGSPHRLLFLECVVLRVFYLAIRGSPHRLSMLQAVPSS